MDQEKNEVLAGRVPVGTVDKFDKSIERPWRKGECLGAAALLWSSLPAKARSDILVASNYPEADLLLELLNSLGLDAAKIVREAEARYQVQKRRPYHKPSASG